MSYPPPPPPPQDPNDPYDQQPGQPGQPVDPPSGPPPGYPSGPPPGQPVYGGYPPPSYQSPAPQTPGGATTSLILGIASLVLCGPFTGIPAIILGVRARRQIRDSGGRLGGDGLALGGLITGVIGTLLWLVVYAFLVFAVWLGAETVNTIRDDICDDVQSSEVDDPNYDLCY